ncbi:MAG: Na/Pi cotransporter family protein [Blautia sp.]|nr:Na/Pi cotransporter family protein [Blautia sp.]
MSIFDLLTLFGGLAMFLYGMRLMGDGLKESASGTLKVAMEHVTNNPFKALLLGTAITAIIQSSTATIVITSGLVGAGILTLHQSLGILVGANIGTTVTGQIIRLLDMDASAGSWLRLFQPSSLAPLALVIGIIIIMTNPVRSSKALGNIAIGFGILFSGLLNMTGAVNTLTESGVFERLFTQLGDNPVLGYATGAGVAFVLQSSSATIGILQAFSASGALTFKAVYPVIVGVYLGDCVTTAIVCSIGAKADARRIGIVNILYNLGKTVLVLVMVALLHRIGFLTDLWNSRANSGIIANSNSIFNICCALCLFPLLPFYERQSRRIIRDDKEPQDKYIERLEALSPAFFATPALALRGCYDVLQLEFGAARENIGKALGMVGTYDEKVHQEILKEEEEIDLLTDRISKYIVELLSHVRDPYHISIINQYYKVVTEFEHLGDCAENIANNLGTLVKGGGGFSQTAVAEIGVVYELTEQILENATIAFEKRNLEAALRVEPLEDVLFDLVGTLKENHLIRMGKGECNVYSDASFMNLLGEIERIADVCSNIGKATVIRINPELAEQEHDYFSALHSGRNEKFNRQYELAKKEYTGKLQSLKTTPLIEG